MEKDFFDAKPFEESYLPSGVEESADYKASAITKYSKTIQYLQIRY